MMQTAEAAFERLREGNRRYLEATHGAGDISLPLRQKTCDEGQTPYAVVIACSDSRVMPEQIFSAGLGELFVIRVAGNVIGRYQLGSVEYAVEHLGCRLVLVLGHDHCGAIDAAMHHKPEGAVRFLTDEILAAIGAETDEEKACCFNVRHSIRRLEASDAIRREKSHGLRILGAVYRLRTGRVEFLEDD